MKSETSKCVKRKTNASTEKHVSTTEAQQRVSCTLWQWHALLIFWITK